MQRPIAYTAAQREIISAEPSDRVLVVAGAGTGKTATLVERLERLASESQLSAASELLVLTFSRAAAAELRRRLRASEGAASYVKVSTFDSFATRLLALHAQDQHWEDAGYDGRIRAGTDLVESDEAARVFVGNYGHLIVDEVQDLVGVRARFVLALIGAIGGGYTLAGDPAQSIYDFQLDETGDTFDSRQFLLSLGSLNSRAPRIVTLTENFRALSDETRVALAAGVTLADPGARYDAVRNDLMEIVDRIDSVEDDYLMTMLRRADAPTGVLTRYNGQALALSRRLHEHGVPHRLQSSATERAIAPWLGSILHDVSSAQLTRTKLERLLGACSDESAPDADTAFALLRRAVASPGDSISIRDLNRRLSSGIVPDDLHWIVDSDVVISTVHRAKGLEFDNVIVIDPKTWHDEYAKDEETRILYVALTRARRSMRLLDPVGPRRMRCKDQPSERWVWFGPRNWQRFGMEVRASDIEFRFPPSGSAYGPGPRVQAYLRDHVGPGDSVELHRFEIDTPDGRRTRYRVHHSGTPIGETTERFGGDLFRVLRVNNGWSVNFPGRLEGLVVESLDTCVGPPADAERAGLGRAGFWLRPRVTGLARFTDW